MRYIKLICVLLPLALSACSNMTHNQSTFQNRDTSYLKAKSLPPLHEPPGVEMDNIESYYPVSDRSYPEANKIVDLTPPGLNSKS